MTTSLHSVQSHNALSVNTSDQICNITLAIQLVTFQLHFCCCAAPCHSAAFSTQRCFSPLTSQTASWTFPGHILIPHRHHYLNPHGRCRSRQLHCVHLYVTTTIGISSSTTTTLSSPTNYAHSSSHCTVLRHSLHLDVCATIPAATATHATTPSVSIRRTFPFVHGATTTSYTTCRTSSHLADPPTSSNTTNDSCSSSGRRPTVHYAPRGLATLLSFSSSHTTSTSTFTSAAASIGH